VAPGRTAMGNWVIRANDQIPDNTDTRRCRLDCRQALFAGSVGDRDRGEEGQTRAFGH
jgi:hypothetical protein